MGTHAVLVIVDEQVPVRDITVVIMPPDSEPRMIFVLADGIKMAALYESIEDRDFSWTEVRKILAQEDFLISDRLMFRPNALVSLRPNGANEEPYCEFTFSGGLTLRQPYTTVAVRDTHLLNYSNLLFPPNRKEQNNG